jgi:hypothetical protein
MASSWRIAIIIDDDLQRRRFTPWLGRPARVYQASDGNGLRKLAAAGAIDVVIAGVLNRNDPFLSSALSEISQTWPGLGLVGLFEPSRPSLDEAADLSREIPAMGFACRPGTRFEHLVRPRLASGLPPTFASELIGCMHRRPLRGAARDFAYLQALHPTSAYTIPEQARELGVSRRNLERWFQGPDICSAGCFQSVCVAAEAAYLRLILGMAEPEIASVVEILTREGAANPIGVSRIIRTGLRLGLEELRAGGISALREAVDVALSTSRDPTRVPAQWAPDTRYAPEPGVLKVHVEGGLTLMDPGRGLQYVLDSFGMDAWPLIERGMSFGKLVMELSSTRRESPHLVRGRLITWLGELLVLRLIRREPNDAEAGEA